MPDVVELWIKKLREPEISVRREAIKQLEAIGDTAALGPLATLFALDPDLETRKLAQWAGKSIYMTAERRIMAQQADASSSDEDRRKAAEILAKANKRKTNG